MIRHLGIPGEKGLLGRPLKIEIDGEHDPAPGYRLYLIDDLDFLARHIDNNISTTHFAAQMRLMARFNARFSYDVTRPITREIFSTQFIGTDLTNAANQMGRALSLDIVAPRCHIGDHTRQRVAMALHLGALQVRKICLERDGLKTTPTPGFTHEACEFDLVAVEQPAEHAIRPFGATDLAGDHANPICRPGGGDYSALAVHDISARRFETQTPNRIAFGTAGEVGALDDLQLEESHHENSKRDQHDDRDQTYAQFARGFLGTREAILGKTPTNHIGPREVSKKSALSELSSAPAQTASRERTSKTSGANKPFTNE